MAASLPWLLLLAALSASPDSVSPSPPAAAYADSSRAIRPDSAATGAARAKPRVVRVFPTVEVHDLVHDMRSNETVRIVSTTALHSFPQDRLTDLIALQPGVVAQAEELHVRGARAGELRVNLDGVDINEPSRDLAMDVPLLALGGAELVSGSPEAQSGGGLAGVLNLFTINPGDHLSSELRWSGDGGIGTRYDRASGRVSGPLHLLDLGAVVAADATFDNTYLPMLRSVSRQDVAGLELGWRAQNRMLGSVKLAPVAHPERFVAEVFVSREVHAPYSPSWSLDGWTYLDYNPKVSPTFHPDSVPGALRYRAADHLDITDDRRISALIRSSALRPNARATLTLGWLGVSTVTSLGGSRQGYDPSHRPKYGNKSDRDGFYVLWGDDPLYRESQSDRLSARGDAELQTPSGSRLLAGVGVYRDHVRLREMDWISSGRFGVDILGPLPLDSIRAYDATAPGGFGYVQGRWQSGGLILNLGLRAEYFTAGPAGASQTLPGSGGGIWSFGPRLGIAYPISVRDVFSLSYSRIQQDPARDYLYDGRQAASNRIPLGNPSIGPATVISYEGAVKHLFGPTWALQGSMFLRDVYGEVGARDATIPAGPFDLRYTDQDESNASGFEWSLTYAASESRRMEFSYTWMQAWGNESRAEGDPYGPIRSLTAPAIGDQPVSWDRRHSFLFDGTWAWPSRWSLSWSTAVGSPLPWTPKPLREFFTAFELVNSRRLEWTENTNASLRWSPRLSRGLTLGLDARNLFDFRGDVAATLDGYPNPIINTQYDDFGAYRTLTGQGGGAYWSQLPEGDPGHWVADDPRLSNAPRTVRALVSVEW